MRIGMIGTGWIAPQHLDAVPFVPGGELVAVAGRTLAKAEALAKPRKAVAYDDWSAMVARERLDAVYICVTPDAAGEISRAVAGKVRGVMVEKPVDVDLASAQRTAQVFAAAGTIAGAAYNNRVRGVVGRVCKLCAEKPVVVADAWWHGGMPGPLWWRTRSQSGGQMSEQATHLADLLRVWMGEAVEVTATAAHGFMTDVPDFTVDDAVVATIRFASGAVATIHTSCIAKHGQEIDSVGISLRARGWQAQMSGGDFATQICFAGGTPAETVPVDANVYRLQAIAFCAAVAAGDPAQLPCSFAEGVATLRLTRAIDLAAASGHTQRV